MTVPESVTPDGLRARADLVRDKLNDGGSCARHLELASDFIELLLAEVAGLYKALDNKRGDRALVCNGDGGEPARLNSLTVGHVVTEADLLDFKNFVADWTAELDSASTIFDDARTATLLEIGGEELLQAVRTHDRHKADESIMKALAQYHKEEANRKKESN